MSTRRGYLSCWRLFESWCKDRGHVALQATSVLVCDFFMYLFTERRIQVRSIETYRSALTFFLKRGSGYDLSTCTVLSDLVRSFKRDRPPAPRVEVRWDIAVVLRYLQSAVFNPDVITPKLLTFKAVFLFSLAAGRRRSEMHALQRSSVVFAPDGSAVTVKPHPKFLSKTHISSGGIGTLEEITVPALPDTADAPFSLCPVRVLKHYLLVSDKYRSPKQLCLFIAYRKCFGRDVCPQTISSYVKRLICEAHRSVDDSTSSVSDIASELNVKAHQVRHVAHSLAQLGSLPLSEIIKTGSWTSASTFIKHYLQFLPHDTVEDLQQVGSFVAIESVFEHKKPVGF